MKTFKISQIQSIELVELQITQDYFYHAGQPKKLFQQEILPGFYYREFPMEWDIWTADQVRNAGYIVDGIVVRTKPRIDIKFLNGTQDFEQFETMEEALEGYNELKDKLNETTSK